MLKVYPGFIKACERPGERLAFIMKNDDPSREVFQTIFVHDEDYEGDDAPPEEQPDDDAEDLPAHGEDLDIERGRSGRRLVVPPEMLAVLKLSDFNKQLLERAVNALDEGMLKMAVPASELPKLNFAMHSVLKGFVDKQSPKPAEKKKGSDETLAGQEFDMPRDGEYHLEAAPANLTFRTAVMGSTGSGKSYWVGMYCKIYRMEHRWSKALEKKRKAERKRKRREGAEEDDDDDEEQDDGKKDLNRRINIFAFAKRDKAYDDIDGSFYVPIQKVMSDSADWVRQFSNSLCVFDDVESIVGPTKDVVLNLRNQCLQTGRKNNISVISIVHEAFCGLETRPVWTESDQIVVFPRHDTHAIMRLLDGKYHMAKKEVEYVLSRKTRAVVIKRTSPRVIMTKLSLKVLM